MTQLTNRDQYESRISERITSALDEHFGKLKVELGATPPRGGASDTFWEQFRNALQGEIQPELEQAYLGMLNDLAAETTVELTDAAARAAEWARGYTYDLVKTMTDNRRALLQGAISDFYDKNLSLGDLYTRLAPEFGPQRAISIAITETTRAASEAQKAFTDSLRQRGVPLVDVIENAQDERVCPVCGPKRGKRASDEGYPPFHVRCRCWFNSVLESEVQ